MEIFKETDIHILHDLAIAHFNNGPFKSFIELTALNQHKYETGQLAAPLFLDQMGIKNGRSIKNKHFES